MSNLRLVTECKRIPDTFCAPFNQERYYHELFGRHHRGDTNECRIGYETLLGRAEDPKGSGRFVFFVLHHGKRILRADFRENTSGVWALWSGGSRKHDNGRMCSNTTYARLRYLSPARLMSEKGTLWCETQDTTDGLYQRGYPTWGGDGPAELHPKSHPGVRWVEFVDGLVVNAAGYAIGADR